MKVFQVLECGGPGGTGSQVAAICNGLDPARFDVGLVYAVRDGKPEEYRAQARGAVEAHYVPQMTREISPFKDLEALGRLTALFKERRPDVVHAHSSKAGVLARLAARAAGVPRVFYSPHGYGFLQRDRSALSRGLYRALEAAASMVGEIVAVSPSEARLAARLSWGKPVHTVCDPYLGEPAPERVPHEGLVVGACARLVAARRPETFLALAQRVTDSRNGVRFVWIGGGELEAKIRRDAENMNLGSRFELTGWLAPEEARRRMRGLDVFVHDSAWDALPNAVLEAMACGLPAVGSPAAADAIADGVTGYVAKSEAELLERTIELLDSADLRAKMGAAGRARIASDFSLDRALAELSDLYTGSCCEH